MDTRSVISVGQFTATNNSLSHALSHRPLPYPKRALHPAKSSLQTTTTTITASAKPALTFKSWPIQNCSIYKNGSWINAREILQAKGVQVSSGYFNVLFQSNSNLNTTQKKRKSSSFALNGKLELVFTYNKTSQQDKNMQNGRDFHGNSEFDRNSIVNSEGNRTKIESIQSMVVIQGWNEGIWDEQHVIMITCFQGIEKIVLQFPLDIQANQFYKTLSSIISFTTSNSINAEIKSSLEITQANDSIPPTFPTLNNSSQTVTHQQQPLSLSHQQNITVLPEKHNGSMSSHVSPAALDPQTCHAQLPGQTAGQDRDGQSGCEGLTRGENEFGPDNIGLQHTLGVSPNEPQDVDENSLGLFETKYFEELVMIRHGLQSIVKHCNLV